MQYQVPQFIETEDKVVGPFSLRQFLYVGVACGVSGICYFLVQTWLFFIIALLLIGGSLALSFIKINGRPLIKIGISAFNFYWRPQAYVWKSDHPVQEHKVTPAVVRESPPVKEVARPTPPAAPTTPKVTAQPQAQVMPLTPPQSPPTPVAPPARQVKTITAIAEGSSLHKAWEKLQSGTPIKGKRSDKQFLEKKMNERYQIFQRVAGDRAAARRIDYR